MNLCLWQKVKTPIHQATNGERKCWVFLEYRDYLQNAFQPLALTNCWGMPPQATMGHLLGNQQRWWRQKHLSKHLLLKAWQMLPELWDQLLWMLWICFQKQAYVSCQFNMSKMLYIWLMDMQEFQGSMGFALRKMDLVWSSFLYKFTLCAGHLI